MTWLYECTYFMHAQLNTCTIVVLDDLKRHAASYSYITIVFSSMAGHVQLYIQLQTMVMIATGTSNIALQAN